MGSEHLTAVADAGPLIHLAEIDCLSLLQIFAELHVPEGVWREADRPPTIRRELTFAKRHVLERDEIDSFTAEHGGMEESKPPAASSPHRSSTP